MANPLGSVTSGVVGAAVGIAAADVAAPVLEVARQQAWRDNAYRVLELGALAELVAQGIVTMSAATEQAKRNGYDANKLAARVQLALVAPEVEKALVLWRKERIDKTLVEHALDKAGIEAQYHAALLDLYDARLDPAVIAVMVQRGVIENEHDPATGEPLLPVGPPTETGRVPPMPTVPIKPLREAKAAGVDFDRLAGMARIVGLPASPDLAARMVFRDIIERVDFDRAISEGNTRNEWAPFLFDGFREIPSSRDGIEGHLRGWISEDEMYAETARHGMSQDDTDLLFKVHGRPPSWHQVWIGLQRGGVYDGPVDDIDPAFLKGLRESDLRPEWYNLLWHSRYNYPSAFVLRSLAQSGDLTEAETEQVLKFVGWEPHFAATVAAKWAAGTGSAEKAATAADLLTLYDARHSNRADTLAALHELGYPAAEAARKLDVLDARRVVTARNVVITDLHTNYKKGAVSLDAVIQALDDLGIATWARDGIIYAWNVERGASA